MKLKRSLAYLVSYVLLGLGIIGIVACSVLFGMQKQNASAQSPSFVRVIHASPDVGTADVFVDGTKLLSSFQAFIESVGTQSNGDLATPTHNPWEDAGWYNLGPHPGERGSAVIDGHLDRPGGYPAVFWRLRDLHVGDEVLVMNIAGKTLHFRVTRTALYSPQEAPLQDIFGNWGGIYLNLLTCAGDWIPSEHQATLRLVVYTSLA